MLRARDDIEVRARRDKNRIEVEITDTGIMGDPTSASAEKGEAILDMLTEYTQSFLQEFRKLPLLQKEK